MNLETFLQGAQNIMGSVFRTLQTNVSRGVIADALIRLESLARNVNRMTTSYSDCESLLPELQEAIHIVEEMKRAHGDVVSTGPPVVRGGKGRPKYDVSVDQLELLLQLHFTNKDIASILNVSESVVKRRLRAFGLSRRHKYSTMTDDELDRHVQSITNGNPSLGQRNVIGQLKSEGHVVQRDRVAESLIRVDSAAVAMRWCRTIHRRTYQVPGPNALWHIDGNHKLIRWGLVIHGGIDGYSRLIVFLRAAANNRAATVFDGFMDATQEYGVPSRVRCDHGVENLDVAVFMNAHRGQNRGSCLTGRSVHNQRIERFWRDLYTGCTNLHKALFEHLEVEEVLHPDNETELWCLQYVYLPRLNRDMKRFVDGWNNHRLSSEEGKTPLQLYVHGIVANRGQGQTGVDDLFFDPPLTDHVPDDFGVEWGGPVPVDTEETRMPGSNCPLTTQQYEEFKRQINPLGESEDGFGIDIYLKAVEFCANYLQ